LSPVQWVMVRPVRIGRDRPFEEHLRRRREEELEALGLRALREEQSEAELRCAERQRWWESVEQYKEKREALLRKQVNLCLCFCGLCICLALYMRACG